MRSLHADIALSACMLQRKKCPCNPACMDIFFTSGGLSKHLPAPMLSTALVQAITQLAANPDLGQAFGQRGREYTA